jgi:hypothetical protein
VFTIPLAALVMGSVAMAATGSQLPEPVQKWIARVTGISLKHAPKPGQIMARPPAAPKTSQEAAPSMAPNFDFPAVEAPPLQSVVPAMKAPEPLVQMIPPAIASSRAAVVPDRQQAVAGESPITEAEFERYRLAHEAHFIKKDPAAALAAWTDYLAHAPSGRLAVEARYNQALCLLKLGRIKEARQALAPFVSGTFGAYRQKEAQTLVASMVVDAGR